MGCYVQLGYRHGRGNISKASYSLDKRLSDPAWIIKTTQKKNEAKSYMRARIMIGRLDSQSTEEIKTASNEWCGCIDR